MVNIAICPGCGLELPGEEKMDKDFNASSACRKLYFDLSLYTLSLRDSYFIHQLIVDAYAASHAGKNVKPIATTFGLIGLYLVFEHGYTGKQAQNAHILLAQKSKIWLQFIPPKEKAIVTVCEVVESPDTQKNEMIKKWAKSVWDIWQKDHQNIAQLVQQYMRV